jgi:hypothetical protein
MNIFFVKDAVFWDVSSCTSCVNRRSFEMSVHILQAPAHIGSSLVGFSTLKMEVIRSSETSSSQFRVSLTELYTYFSSLTCLMTHPSLPP